MIPRFVAYVAVAVILVSTVGAFASIAMERNASSDYTLLDDSLNIEEGMKITLKGTSDGVSTTEKYSVTGVSGTSVKYSHTYEMKSSKYISGGMYSLGDFSPDMFFFLPGGFNYTSEDVPSGYTVKREGDTYIISGTHDESMFFIDSSTYSFVNFRITLTEGEVTDVSGEIEGESSGFGDTSETKLSFKTEDGVLKYKLSSKSSSSSMSRDIQDFFGDVLTAFDENEYEGADIAESQEKYGNVTATVYSITGTSDEGKTYDLRVVTYRGYVLDESGTVDGENEEYKVRIYISKNSSF
ncbi:hypothetical protein TALC_00765 [Thermoplasmatales archaeon BRNA1]|nr:hypothetical protein TALC_00765 [Thermoplasmatales archaeon BRNA1]